MSLATELLKEFESQIELLEIIPADGGRFEVSVNGELMFSKLALGRHAAIGEIIQTVRGKLS